jgi:hypothetical protein
MIRSSVIWKCARESVDRYYFVTSETQTKSGKFKNEFEITHTLSNYYCTPFTIATSNFLRLIASSTIQAQRDQAYSFCGCEIHILAHAALTGNTRVVQPVDVK